MKENTISTGKAIWTVVIAVLIMILAQLVSFGVGSLVVMLGVPEAIGTLVTGILYPVITFIGVRHRIKNSLEQEMVAYRITPIKVKPVWCAVAVLLPCIVSGVLLATPGHFVASMKPGNELVSTVIAGVFFMGIGAGIVEEMVFRGLIMGVLEKRWNRTVGVLVPSIVFGALHVLGSKLSFGSFIQLLIAGSIVGILFSLIAYESKSIWSGVIVHSIWNIVMIGGILHIGDSAKEVSVYSYVLETKSFLITGGDFGVEASIISILAYAVAIVLAIRLIKKEK